MTKRKHQDPTEKTFEQLFPDPKGRRAIDAVIDAMPVTATLHETIEACEQAYFEATGTSPFRPKK